MAPTLKTPRATTSPFPTIGSHTVTMVHGPSGLPCVTIFGHTIEIGPNSGNLDVYIDGELYVPYKEETIAESENASLEFEMSDHFSIAIEEDMATQEFIVTTEVPFSNGNRFRHRHRINKDIVNMVGGIVIPDITLGSNIRIVRAKKEGAY